MAALLAGQAWASVERRDVEFAFHRQTNFGESVFVVGSLPELGGWDLSRAVKLQGRHNPDWSVNISLPEGETYEYVYILRQDAPGLLGQPNNMIYLSDLQTGVVQTSNALAVTNGDGDKPPAGIVIEGEFDSPVLYYRQLGLNEPFHTVEMTDIGNGVRPGEVRWAALDLEHNGRGYEFLVLCSSGTLMPQSGTWKTPLREIYIRDGEMFSEIPPVEQTESRVLPTRNYQSDALGGSRNVRIYLPRNYGQIEGKRYPVVYMHDGQAMFGGHGTWRTHVAANEQIASGQMREVIIVAIDNAGYDARFRDYVPNGDGSFIGPGNADAYTAFIRDELKPQIDAEFMTIDDPYYTGTIGSSLGAICAMYQGFAHGDTFKRVGALSGAWPFSANFNQTLDDDDADTRDLRVYIDSGDAGPSFDNYSITSGVRSLLLKRDDYDGKFSFGRNFDYRVGLGDSHEPSAWARRIPGTLSFLYPADEDAVGLAGLEIWVRGDVNDDGLVDIRDLHDFNTSPPRDIDNDGLAGTPDDYQALLAMVPTADPAEKLGRFRGNVDNLTRAETRAETRTNRQGASRPSRSRR